MDNQVFSTPYPIVLFPELTQVPITEGGGFEPFLHLSMVKSMLKVSEFSLPFFYLMNLKDFSGAPRN